MTTLQIYHNLKNQQPQMKDCFFSFSNSQFEEGVKKHNLEGQKLYNGGQGLYGTKEGIENFMNFYDNISKEIGLKCDPQEVYEYEFDNHECSYTNSDEEVMEILKCYFGDDVKVKRRYGHRN